MKTAFSSISVSLLAMAAADTALAASEPPTGGALTIVVLPDTQNYAGVPVTGVNAAT